MNFYLSGIRLLSVMMLICAVAMATPAASLAEGERFSDDTREHKKIAYLISSIDDSDAVFIRNGKEYDAKKASEHMEYKAGKANGRIKTARQFIHYIASRSFLSGKPYYIRNGDGKKVTARKWLFRKLYEYEQHNGDQFYRLPTQHRS